MPLVVRLPVNHSKEVNYLKIKPFASRTPLGWNTIIIKIQFEGGGGGAVI